MPLTVQSLGRGGTWGKRGSRYARVPIGRAPDVVNWSEEDSETVKKIKTTMQAPLQAKFAKGNRGPDDLAKTESLPVVRAYLDLLAAAQAFDDAEFGVEELDLGAQGNPAKCRGRWSACCWCGAITLAVSAAFIFPAYFLAAHAADVRLCYPEAASGEGLGPRTPGCTEEDRAVVALKFLGWPEEPTDQLFWYNIYCGLMLGLIFGFLDNFGLFYGMGALDGVFYQFATQVAAGLMKLCRRDTELEKQALLDEVEGAKSANNPELMLRDMHAVASDLMAGLGNTFSGTPPPLYVFFLLAILEKNSHAFPPPFRSCRCHPRYRSPRDCQGGLGRRPRVLAVGSCVHCAWLLARCLFARADQVPTLAGRHGLQQLARQLWLAKHPLSLHLRLPGRRTVGIVEWPHTHPFVCLLGDQRGVPRPLAPGLLVGWLGYKEKRAKLAQGGPGGDVGFVKNAASTLF